MNRIEFYFRRIREIICQHYHINHLYETSVGIKGVYGIKAPPALPLTGKSFVCNASELYLGVDLLKDDYTLLGRSLLESPHFYLMKAIADNSDLSKSEYIRRCEKGTLDGRLGTKHYTTFEYYENAYKKRVAEIEAGISDPVYVYKIGGRLFVYDGKHRAALCAFMNKPIHCVEVSPERFGPAIRLMSNKESYSKHLSLYQESINEKMM